ncbi:response regulator transcription factor [Dyadobacter fermentans]|uniref:response regulator transcription factor n=1 Tax=Dyadobacter fermentans TaxID=94254 RepID=UPI001650E31F
MLNPKTGTWEVSSYRQSYPGIDDDQLLNKREIDILRHIADGLGSILIADKLSISHHTVNTHRDTYSFGTLTERICC